MSLDEKDDADQSYFSDLDPKTNTRFDYLSAVPTSREQFIVWTTWSAVAGLVGILVSIFFLGILSSRKARRRSFNVYVLFITFPDMFFSLACAVTCGLSAAFGRYYSERMCSFQSFYTTFAFTANAWMNGVIVRQVHCMLKCSHRRERYKPPLIKTVCTHAACVYIYAAIIASFTLFRSPALHHQLGRGLACLPLEHDVTSSLFFWLCFFWLMMGIPLTYVTYVLYDVKRRKLLPPGGRTRSIAIFFARITTVFVVMWLPTMIAIYMSVKAAGPWFGFIGGVWSHLQPLVSASVACMKGDVAEAVRSFVCCNHWWADEEQNRNEEDDLGQAQRASSSGFSTGRSSDAPHRSSVFNSFLKWNQSASRKSSVRTGKVSSTDTRKTSSAASKGSTSVVSTDLPEEEGFDAEENRKHLGETKIAEAEESFGDNV